MKRACIAIIDASRARIYAYQHDVSDDPNEQLREVVDFVNPARQLRDSELLCDSRPGTRTEAGAIRDSGHTIEDHRDAHSERNNLDFAKRIVSEIDRVVHELRFGHVVLVASPNMLGDLRKADSVLRRPDLTLDEITRDLTKLTSPQLHGHLARLKLISPRTRLVFAHRL